MFWKDVKGPDLEREYRFDAKRRWRADFAHVGARVLIEIEGGIDPTFVPMGVPGPSVEVAVPPPPPLRLRPPAWLPG